MLNTCFLLYYYTPMPHFQKEQRKQTNFCLLNIVQGKMDTTPAAAGQGMKPAAGIAAAPQPSRIATPPLTGIGKIKACFCPS